MSKSTVIRNDFFARMSRAAGRTGRNTAAAAKPEPREVG